MTFFTYGFEKRAKEILKGGKGDGKTDADFPKDQVAMGKKVEREHTNNPEIADEIVHDHLSEDKKYYSHLQKMEDKYAFVVGFSKQGKELTTKGRKQISEGNFALPGRRYPIHDESHARNALARVAQFGTSAEKETVRRAVHQKYPGIGEK